MHCRSVVLAATLVFPSPAIEAQISDGAACPARVVIPGGSNEADRTAHRCNLDNAPTLRSTLEGLPSPMYGRQVHSDMTVVVDADGRVNTDLTRYLSVSSDSVFHRQMLEAVRRLSHESGRMNGKAVRYGYLLLTRSSLRSDTVPEALRWRHVRGVLADSLVGIWEPVTSEPPLSTERLIAIARAVTRTLREMQVLLPEHGQIYCLITDETAPDVIREAVRTQLAEGPYQSHVLLGPHGCESDVNYRRFRIGTPLRTGRGRTVVRASGDFLRSWPPGLDGRWWHAWRAYCIVPDVPEDGSRSECEVTPVHTGDRAVDTWGADRGRGAPDSSAAVVLSVEVTTTGAFRTDTIRSSIARIPRLEDRTLFRTAILWCTGGAAWTALADWPGAGEIVVWLTVPSGSAYRASVHLIEVRRPDSRFRFTGVDCGQSRVEQSLALFTLGGVGQPLRGTVRFCLNEPDCRQSFDVDPARHELATQPHVTFRLADIRAAARRGSQVHFRLRLDRSMPNLVPFVVVRTPDRNSAFLLRALNDREFDFAVHHTPPFPAETVFLIYLATAGQR